MRIVSDTIVIVALERRMGTIIRDRGIPAFFAGLSLRCIKRTPLAAMNFYMHERLKMHHQNLLGRD
jgi:hypothetical protein